MIDITDIVCPVINNNGTSFNELMRERLQACTDLRTALKTVQDVTTHGRDYQTEPNQDKYKKAREQHNSIMRDLENAVQYFTQQAILIREQQDERDRWKR